MPEYTGKIIMLIIETHRISILETKSLLIVF